MPYEIKPLPCDPKRLKGLSEKLIVSHWENNYGGAVKRLNAITAQLTTLDFATAPVFVVNGLKREELIATNSMILHELYFDGLGAEGEPDRALRDALVRDCDSFERWRTEFVAMGKAMGGGSGWVLLTYSSHDRKLVNQWAADHRHSLAGAARSWHSTCTSTRITWTTALRRRSTWMHSWRTFTEETSRGSIGSTRAKRFGDAPKPASSLACGRGGIRGMHMASVKDILRMSGIAVAAIAGLVILSPAIQGPTAQQQSEAEWKPVEEALGKSGQLQADGVFRVAMPRTDLNVKVQGVDVKAGFALGSYAAFRRMGKDAMVMGDLVLLDEEVQGVMVKLLAKGIAVTALHNHLNEMSPHVMYMHYGGRGDAVQLATSIREALSASGTPLGQSAAGGAPPSGGPAIDQKQVEAALGRTGRVNNGILQVGVARAERITENGMELLPSMGVNTALNFQPTGDGKAAITGDFVLIGREVNPVAKALREHGIQVTALHNHALGDNPRLFYMHFWANDDAVKLAQGLKAALDLTNSKKAEGVK